MNVRSTMVIVQYHYCQYNRRSYHKHNTVEVGTCNIHKMEYCISSKFSIATSYLYYPVYYFYQTFTNLQNNSYFNDCVMNNGNNLGKILENASIKNPKTYMRFTTIHTKMNGNTYTGRNTTNLIVNVSQMLFKLSINSLKCRYQNISKSFNRKSLCFHKLCEYLSIICFPVRFLRSFYF